MSHEGLIICSLMLKLFDEPTLSISNFIDYNEVFGFCSCREGFIVIVLFIVASDYQEIVIDFYRH